MKRLLPPFLLVVLLVAFSLVGAKWQQVLPGFSPLPAVFFCVAACMGVRWLWLPVAAWLLSYPLTNLTQGYGWDFQIAIALGGFAVVAGAGYSLRKRNWVAMMGGSIGAAILFYAVTNTGSWLLLPQYSKTWAGFVQAQTVGVPGPIPPAWVFLRGSIAASALFSGLFLLGQRKWGSVPAGATALATVHVRR
ncbi:MAG: DUF6580 family putative transport protein [Roseibacillus sp.]